MANRRNIAALPHKDDSGSNPTTLDIGVELRDVDQRQAADDDVKIDQEGRSKPDVRPIDVERGVSSDRSVMRVLPKMLFQRAGFQNAPDAQTFLTPILWDRTTVPNPASKDIDKCDKQQAEPALASGVRCGHQRRWQRYARLVETILLKLRIGDGLVLRIVQAAHRRNVAGDAGPFMYQIAQQIRLT